MGIETSCDETAVSVVGNGRRVYSNVVSSSLKFHRRYKGIIPEIASRLHIETINIVTEDAVKQAGTKLEDIGLIAVTAYPGLPGSLLVGNCFASALSFSLNIPLIKINHLHAHLYASFLSERRPCFPFVGLVVSGGHTNLFYVRSFSRIESIGCTQDDACGEAFDKVAIILNLGYPGGPIIEKLATQGDRRRIIFRCSNTRAPLDFSFSGIKTAVLYYVKNNLKVKDSIMRKDKRHLADVAASFQEVVIDTLIRKSILACRFKNTKRLVIGGGVSVNNRLRERFVSQARDSGLDIYFSPREFCTDNAAMVAGLGYCLRKN